MSIVNRFPVGVKFKLNKGATHYERRLFSLITNLLVLANLYIADVFM